MYRLKKIKLKKKRAEEKTQQTKPLQYKHKVQNTLALLTAFDPLQTFFLSC